MVASREQFLSLISLSLRRVYSWITLIDSLYLLDHTNSTRAHLSSLITMNQLLEIWQERDHAKVDDD
jgi:hypothetical protein